MTDILEFWFADALSSPNTSSQTDRWFGVDEQFDAEILDRFGELPDRALRMELESWRESPSSCLALVLVVDQFPRNLYRENPRAFHYDAFARSVADEAIARGHDQALHPIQAAFFYLPFEHAENLELQHRAVRLLEALLGRAPDSTSEQIGRSLEYARRHREVIRRFGRFPHRNFVLGRESTLEEKAYLQSGGETFGGEASIEARSSS